MPSLTYLGRILHSFKPLNTPSFCPLFMLGNVWNNSQLYFCFQVLNDGLLSGAAVLGVPVKATIKEVCSIYLRIAYAAYNCYFVDLAAE